MKFIIIFEIIFFNYKIKIRIFSIITTIYVSLEKKTHNDHEKLHPKKHTSITRKCDRVATRKDETKCARNFELGTSRGLTARNFADLIWQGLPHCARRALLPISHNDVCAVSYFSRNAANSRYRQVR